MAGAEQAVSADTITVRGTPVMGLLHFIDKELSKEQKAAICREVPDPWGERFSRNGVLASDRVPLSALNRLCTLAAQARGEAVEEFSERAGTYGAKEGIATVFKPFFYILSVQNALGIAPLMWARIYDAGQMCVNGRAKGAEIRVTGYAGDPSGCARAMGWFRYIGELSGAKNVVAVHGPCTAKGGDADVWTFNWE